MPIYKTGRTENGKTQYRVFVNVTDQNGKQKRLTRCVYGKAEAKAVEHELKEKAAESASPGKMTVRDLYEVYMAAKKHDVRTSSYNKSRSILSNHVTNTEIISVRLDKLSKAKLQEWKNELAEKDIMISTKNNVIREFTAMLNFAVKMDYLSKNPLSELGRFKDPYFTKPEEKMQIYMPEEFKRYIKAAEDSRKNMIDYGCYIFFMIAYYTGMRKGEITALKWSDLEGDTIHVTRSLCQKIKGYEETPPKNKSSYRDLQIPQKLRKVLEVYRDTMKQKTRYSENLRICGGYKPLTDSTIENHNKQYSEAAGLPHIRIHDFRHSHASLLICEGVNIKEVSRRLGHANVQMTWNTYAHLFPKVKEKAVAVLENI